MVCHDGITLFYIYINNVNTLTYFSTETGEDDDCCIFSCPLRDIPLLWSSLSVSTSAVSQRNFYIAASGSMIERGLSNPN